MLKLYLVISFETFLMEDMEHAIDFVMTLLLQCASTDCDLAVSLVWHQNAAASFSLSLSCSEIRDQIR